jgi:hypothetical protein
MRVKQLIHCKVESYFEPKAGNFTLGVEVELEGRTERQVPVNPFHAVLFDEAGNEYRPTLAGCKPGLRSQRISKDEKASGVIAFELPTAARGLSLSYTPFIVGSAKQEVAFQLGR